MRSDVGRPAGRPRNPELDAGDPGRGRAAASRGRLRRDVPGVSSRRRRHNGPGHAPPIPHQGQRGRRGHRLAAGREHARRVGAAPQPRPRDPAEIPCQPVAQELHGGSRHALAEEHRHPELLAAFRHRLVEPRRAALRRVLAEGISGGELPDSADPEVLASMLIGSFYARYIATSDLPDDWAERSLRQVWPDAPPRPAVGA